MNGSADAEGQFGRCAVRTWSSGSPGAMAVLGRRDGLLQCQTKSLDGTVKAGVRLI